ncbi:MAG: hypothetical protein IT366_25175 [Candidatus Hydrogenedentes bacterium]|nr:hypothetical protein [Candidatus Hydrogenedentota bacterium]
MSRKNLSLVLLAAVGLPLVIGCQFLLLRICVQNETPYFLDEFTVKASGDLTYPDGELKNVPPGGTGTVRRLPAGSYDLRAQFDIADESVCEDTVEVLNVELENTNLCVIYEVQSTINRSVCDEEIYATLDYTI